MDPALEPWIETEWFRKSDQCVFELKYHDKLYIYDRKNKGSHPQSDKAMVFYANALSTRPNEESDLCSNKEVN